MARVFDFLKKGIIFVEVVPSIVSKAGDLVVLWPY
jgi:hypothetical protein